VISVGKKKKGAAGGVARDTTPCKFVLKYGKKKGGL